MLRSIFGKAVWDRRRSMLWWVIGLIALTAWLAAFYPVIRDSEAMTSFVDNMPEGMMAMFGIDPATFLTGAGFLQAQLFSFLLPIVILVFTIGFGVAATSKEEHSGTMDMLLSVPVSRTSVLLQKTAAMVVLTAVLTTAIAVALMVANPIVDLELSINGILAATTALLLLGLVFGGVALLVGTFTGMPSSAAGVAGGLAILAWIVNAFSAMFSWLEIPSKLSPFSWYLDELPLLSGFNSGDVWLVLAFVALAGASIFLFRKRDIATEQAVLPQVATRNRKVKVVTPRSAWLLGSIFGKSVWDRRRSIWYWSIGLASMSLLTFAAWPALSRDTAALQGMMDAMPKEVLAMFGLTDPQALSTPEGFVSSRTYGSVGPIVVIVFAVTAMSSLVAREEASGTLDLVLSNPVPRRKVLSQKAFAVAALMGVLVTFLAVVAFAGSAIWDMGFNALYVVAANVGLGLLGLCFWGIAVALWSLVGSGSAIGITAAIAVFTFFLNGLGAIVDILAPFRYLSPFYWYLGDTVPLAKGFTFGYVMLAVVAIAGTAIAVQRFQARNLAT